MNREAVEKTIEALRASGSYDQGAFWNPCGTPACVAGHCLAAHGVKYHENYRLLELADQWRGSGFMHRTAKAAAFLMDLPFGPANVLFEACPPELAGRPTAADAIATLEGMLKNGRVEWRRAEVAAALEEA